MILLSHAFECLVLEHSSDFVSRPVHGLRFWNTVMRILPVMFPCTTMLGTYPLKSVLFMQMGELFHSTLERGLLKAWLVRMLLVPNVLPSCIVASKQYPVTCQRGDHTSCFWLVLVANRDPLRSAFDGHRLRLKAFSLTCTTLNILKLTLSFTRTYQAVGLALK